MEATVPSILQTCFEPFSRARRLAPPIYQAARALMQCRTAVYGGQVQRCPEGQVAQLWCNGCKHRCCPQCAPVQTERWLDRIKARLLGGAHYHVVFTLPHEFNPLWLKNPDVMPSLFFRSVRDTLMGLLGDDQYLGALPGLILTLHTWGRTWVLHPHIHALVTAGGWAGTGVWQATRKDDLLPVQVVKALLRGKLLAAIRTALESGELRLPAEVSESQLRTLLNKWGRKAWNLHIQTRYDHGEGVLTYLARYVRGGPIRNARLLHADEDPVTFRYTDHRDGKDKTMDLSPEQFMQRLFLHVPEPGAHRVRYYGLYARGQQELLNECRQHVGQPPIEPVEYLDWQIYCQRRGWAQPGRCPVCGKPLLCTDAFPPGGIPPPLEKVVTPTL